MAFGPPEFAGSPLAVLDFSWLAVDRDGHVAWLVTFGSAVVPPWVEGDPDAFGEAETLLASLPERGGDEAKEPSSALREWLEAARRGVFGYDWSAYEGPYKLVARPASPVEVSVLPRVLAELALRTRFDHLCFNDSPVLQVSDVVACTPRP
jgi:hypothetical protein